MRHSICSSHNQPDRFYKHMATQTYEEIIDILKSQTSIKDIRISLKAEFFGVDWAAGQEVERFTGTLANWKKKDETVMILWEGWNKNRQCSLAALKEDADGESLELAVLDYAGEMALRGVAAPAAVGAK
ncbi:hypothetical protein AB1Y20_021823 [Prymnesium parvum]|uniref:Uncharacterized protein n=1 Tax=Prymnesium parvum TaxID=97485 RepID=A0AB34JKV3_PRYPA